jgi:hypothetical protein
MTTLESPIAESYPPLTIKNSGLNYKSRQKKTHLIFKSKKQTSKHPIAASNPQEMITFV